MLVAPTPTAPSGTINTLTPVFTWSGGSGAANYEINVSDTTTGAIVLRQQGISTGSTSFTMPAGTLGNSRQYRWDISACPNVACNAGYETSGNLTFTTPAAAPTLVAPTPTAPSGTINTLTPVFTWSGGSGAANYEINVRDTTTGAIVLRQQGISTGSTSFTMPAGTLVNSRQYRWDISACPNFACNAGYETSGNLTFTTPAAAPTLVAPTPTAPSGTINTLTPVFTWSGGSGAANYEINVRDTTTGSIVLRQQGISTGSTSFTMPAGTLVNSRQYRWDISACPNVACNAGYETSGNLTFTTPAAAPTLVAPTPTAPSGTINTLTPVFTWSGGSGAANYEINVRDTTTGSIVLRQQGISTGSTSFTMPAGTLVNSRQYRWDISACPNFACNAGYATSGNLTFTTPAAAPTLVAPTPTAPSGTITTLTPVFTWSGGSGAANYEINVRDTTTGSIVLRQQGISTGSTSFTMPAGTLVNSRQYRWDISACPNVACNAGYETSGNLTFTTPAAAPTLVAPTPTAPSGTINTLTPVFTWSGGSGAANYEINVRDTTTGSIVLRQQGISTGSTSFTMPAGTLVNSRQYRWDISACPNFACNAGYETSGNLTFTTPAAAPTLVAPTPTAPSGTINTLTPVFTWSGGSGAANYEINVRDTTTGSIVLRQQGISTGSTSFTMPAGTLVNSRQYRWDISACPNVACNAGYETSGNLTFTTPAAAPTLVAPTPTAPSGTINTLTPVFTWSGGSGAANYEINVRDTTTGAIVLRQQGISTGSTSFTMPAGTLVNSRQYRWDISACPNFACNAGYETSGNLTFTTPAAAPTLVAPTPTAPSGTINTLTPVFTWSGGSGAANYEINVRDTTTGSIVLRQQGISTGSTSFTMPAGTLVNSRQYRWDISACPNFACNAGYETSGNLTFTTPAAAPTLVAPTPTAPSGTINTLTPVFTWSGGSGAANYEINVRDTTTGSIVLRQQGISTGSTSFTMPAGTLVNSRQYRWDISACPNVACNAGYETSGNLTFTTPAAAPTLVAPTPTAPSGTINTLTPVFTWSGGSGAANYEINVRDTTTGSIVLRQQGISTGSTSFTMPAGTLVNSRQYRWDISACPNFACNAGYETSGNLTFTTPAAAPTLVAPTPTAPSGTINTLTPVFTWSGGSGAANYEINVRDTTTGSIVLRQQGISTGSTSFTMPAGTLVNSRQYRWDISACPNFACNAGYATSGNLTFTTPAAAPTLVAPTPTAPSGTITTLTPVFTWSGGSGAANYEINVRDTTTGSIVLRQQGISTGSTSFTMPAGTLVNSRQYRWDISACPNFACNAGYATSGNLTFTTPAAAPAIPSTPSQLTPGQSSSPGPLLPSNIVQLNWEDVGGATFYQVAVRDLTTNTLVVDVQTSSSIYSVSLSRARSFRWNVSACNATGCSSFSSPLYFRTP
ncbi:hypothetical protein [Piscinibacter sakaiensis]|uniref:hypothetical protein n=1 Tax=Piscinibacter sakaiensis TaxID=1547922 RepID=UPI003AAEA74F